MEVEKMKKDLRLPGTELRLPWSVENWHRFSSFDAWIDMSSFDWHPGLSLLQTRNGAFISQTFQVFIPFFTTKSLRERLFLCNLYSLLLWIHLAVEWHHDNDGFASITTLWKPFFVASLFANLIKWKFFYHCKFFYSSMNSNFLHHGDCWTGDGYVEKLKTSKWLL